MTGAKFKKRMKRLLSDFLILIFGEPKDDAGYSWKQILLTLIATGGIVILILISMYP